MRGRRQIDEQLAALVAAGVPFVQAAQRLGISETTAFRRAKEPWFRERVSQLRRQATDQAVGLLAEALAEAVARLRDLMRQTESLSVAQRAAVAVLEFGLRAQALTDLETRIQHLEQQSGATDEPSQFEAAD